METARARFRAPDVDPKNFPAVGPYLEAVREQQGLSVATLSDRTHIKASYIESIDRMAVDALPSKSFAIGFVRSYAEALGLDPGPIVDRFKDEAGYSALAAKAEPAPEAPSPETMTAREPARLSLIAVLGILAFMIWCALLITRPGADAVRRPLKLEGVPLSIEQPEARVVYGQAPEPEAAPPADFEPVAPAALPVIVEARVIERVEPVYPPDCEANAGAVETVDVAFTVTPSGGVVSQRVIKSSNACFERAGLNAVKRWRFEPKTIDGAPRPAFEQQASFRFERPS